jgi:hypothetical protein
MLLKSTGGKRAASLRMEMLVVLAGDRNRSRCPGTLWLTGGGGIMQRQLRQEWASVFRLFYAPACVSFGKDFGSVCQSRMMGAMAALAAMGPK